MNETEHYPSTTYVLPYQGKATFNITITDRDNDGKKSIYSIFINSLNLPDYHYLTAIANLINTSLTFGTPIEEVISSLLPVVDFREGNYWHKGTCYPSLIAQIADILKKHSENLK